MTLVDTHVFSDPVEALEFYQTIQTVLTRANEQDNVVSSANGKGVIFGLLCVQGTWHSVVKVFLRSDSADGIDAPNQPTL
jgi:hypothetical protein